MGQIKEAGWNQLRFRLLQMMLLGDTASVREINPDDFARLHYYRTLQAQFGAKSIFYCPRAPSFEIHSQS